MPWGASLPSRCCLTPVEAGSVLAYERDTLNTLNIPMCFAFGESRQTSVYSSHHISGMSLFWHAGLQQPEMQCSLSFNDSS